MELSGLLCCLAFFLAVDSTYSSPIVSQPSSKPSSLIPSSLSLDTHQPSRPSKRKVCTPVEVTKCSAFYDSTQMPNVFGVYSQSQAANTLRDLLSTLGSTNKLVTSFLCSAFIPPCPSGSKFKVKSTLVPLPCRATCEKALLQSRGSLSVDPPLESWPMRCHTLPSDNCFAFDETPGLHYVKPGKPTGSKNKRRHVVPEVASFAPLEIELGEEEDTVDDGDDGDFKVEVVSLTSSQIPERLSEITDLGDPELFHGWVDVQGAGAANDYCRVVGNGKRKFLSCSLAGSVAQGHHYVSKLGADLGHAGTWFMKDMDSDGRDDYCRCVGIETRSRVTCMKAGERGFYGSITQRGSEHTFTVPDTENCVTKMAGQDSTR